MVPKTCSIPECERKRFGHGWCQKHYGRWRTHGDPNFVLHIRGNDLARLLSTVRKTESCWIWTGSANDAGYGQMHFRGKVRKAHRVSYELKNGPIPDGLTIDHRCHVPSCVNPDHLRLATLKQNSENRSGASANSKSGVRGVSWDKKSRSWRAQVSHFGKRIYVGCFATIPEAEDAVTAKRNELFTHNDLDRVRV